MAVICDSCKDIAPSGDERNLWLSVHLSSFHQLVWSIRNKFKKPEQYSHVNSKGVRYYLFSIDVTLRGGKPQRIYFFNIGTSTTYANNKTRVPVYRLPKGRKVHENTRNGFLTIGPKNERRIA